MVKALVTGATGFVGAHVARLLTGRGHQVRVLRRASSRLDAIADLKVEHVIGDLDDVNQLTEQLQGVEWVFHIAAVADYWRSGKASIYRANVDGTHHLLLAAERAGVKRFIFTSSAAAIGYLGRGRTADETTYFNINPNLSPYGHSKFLAEAEVQQAVKRGLAAVILNPVIILGPGDLNQISGSLILEVKRGNLVGMPQGGGTNFIDVRDIAQAHLAAAEKGRVGERYILGAVNMTHKAMLKLTCEVVGASEPRLPVYNFMLPATATIVDAGRKLGLPIPADGNQLRLSGRDIYFNTEKMWRELHIPQIDIRQSIQDTYTWYQANGYV